MRLAVKRKLIDDITKAFISIMAKNKSKIYQSYLNKINRDIIANVDTLSISKLKSIVNKYSIDIKDSVLLFTVLSAITDIINKPRMTSKEKLPLLPIIAVLGIYSILKPKQFAQRIVKINKGIGLNDNEKKTKELLNSYYKDNEKAISNSVKAVDKEMVKSAQQSARTTSKHIREDLHKMVSEKKLTIEQMETSLQNKYTNNKAVIERNLVTELHNQAELVKLERAKVNGFTHKTWIQQQRKTKRETKFHNGVVNKRIPIDSEFKAAGQHAMQPGDISLEAKDKIRCGCYLIYD